MQQLFLFFHILPIFQAHRPAFFCCLPLRGLLTLRSLRHLCVFCGEAIPSGRLGFLGGWPSPFPTACPFGDCCLPLRGLLTASFLRSPVYCLLSTVFLSINFSPPRQLLFPIEARVLAPSAAADRVLAFFNFSPLPAVRFSPAGRISVCVACVGSRGGDVLCPAQGGGGETYREGGDDQIISNFKYQIATKCSEGAPSGVASPQISN
jgi:hypothetical protein